MNGFNDSDVGAAIHSLIMNFLSGNVHTSMPGKVVKYDAVKKTVDVKPMLKKANPDGTQIEYPVLPDVPLLFGETSALSITATVGDVVLLVFSEAGLEKWSPTRVPANTTINRKFSLSDGFAVPGIYSTGVLAQQALLTAAYKTALAPYLAAVQALLLAVATLTPATIATALGTFNAVYAGGFVSPVNSLTSKVKAA